MAITKKYTLKCSKEMKMLDVQASFAVCMTLLIVVHCATFSVSENGNEISANATCDCANNGICVVGEGVEKFCICRAGTGGDLCERVLDCDEWLGICDFESECVYDESTGRSKCVCEDSTKLFDFEAHQCRVPCNDDCHNGGKCEYVRNIKFCSCKRGTSGDLCETVDECRAYDLCGRNTDLKCVYDVTQERATCECVDPNKSLDSTSNECRTTCATNDDCPSFEKCTETPEGKHMCLCPPGTSGEQCGIINECINGKYKTCNRNNGRCFYNKEKERAECDCGVGKMWDHREHHPNRCRKTCNDNCAHNTYCYSNGDAKFCLCNAKTEGDLCEKVKACSKEKNLCGSGNDVKCVFDERAYITKCVCENSTKILDHGEKRCRVPCKDDCHNNGKCEYVQPDKYCQKKCKYYPRFCFCQQGTSGDLCETVDACTEKDFCGSKTDVKCVYNETKYEATCKCNDPNKSFDSYAKMCKPFCRTNTDCLSTERCMRSEHEQEICVCKSGRSGDKCQFVDECITGRYSDCKGGNGRCSYNDVTETAECDCGIGKRWEESKTMCRYTCKDDCVNNGTCEGEDDAKFCRCNVGTSGDHCEVVHDCDWAKICGNSTDVKCVFDESTGGGNCLCDNNTKIFDYHRKECRGKSDQ